MKETELAQLRERTEDLKESLSNKESDLEETKRLLENLDHTAIFDEKREGYESELEEYELEIDDLEDEIKEIEDSVQAAYEFEHGL